ncbi:hypothetical protein G7Y89_g15295 [Cudoniella acicularis]|uniref:Association with the SNF1 complex (ASC) domain-containing protein n=1 Tax=Cudoniella acicularis TaxID=354080 RepID=A0A8H4QSI5_9HELO|nr:hypothetical protein G7Y89_g15295 [Cudoniella acicularis]
MGNTPSSTRHPHSASQSPSPSSHESSRAPSSRRAIQNQRSAAAPEPSLAQARGTTATHRTRASQSQSQSQYQSQSLPTAQFNNPSASIANPPPHSSESQMGAQQSRAEPDFDTRDKPTQPVDVPVPAANPDNTSLRSYSQSIEPSGPPTTQDMSYHLTRPPRLPLPIEEEVHTGPAIIAPADVDAPALDLEALDNETLPRRASALSNTTIDEEDAEELRVDKTKATVATKLEWLEGKGGEKVYVTGTIFQWNKKHRLHPVAARSLQILHSPENKVVEEEPKAKPPPKFKPTIPHGRYSSQVPQYLLDLDKAEDSSAYQYAAAAIEKLPQPPSLPGFLGKPILNAATPMKDDNSVLTMPNHTVLNHLATSSIKNNVLAVSATTRYKRKVSAAAFLGIFDTKTTDVVAFAYCKAAYICLGLGLAKYYLSTANSIVIAAVRNPGHPTSQTLRTLQTHPSSTLILVPIESTSKNTAVTAISTLQSQHGISHLDVVIANAGISDVWPEVKDVKEEDMVRHYAVNVIGVALLFQAVLPLLEKAKVPKFITMGSSAGILTGMENVAFPNAAYGPSKVAVHYLTKKIHIENEGLIAFPIDLLICWVAGFVQTDLGDIAAHYFGFEKAFITVDESVAGMVKVIDGATREKTSGKLWVYDGKECAW